MLYNRPNPENPKVTTFYLFLNGLVERKLLYIIFQNKNAELKNSEPSIFILIYENGGISLVRMRKNSICFKYFCVLFLIVRG